MTGLQRLARLRVPLGFLFGACVFYFAHPTWRTLAAGAAIGLLGEAIRLWAAGHLEKSREVTRSGPYRYMRHPLYNGSSLIALGVMIASDNFVVSLLVLTYILTTIPASIRAEEMHLRSTFGDLYDRYTKAEAPGVERPFSFERVMRNKEYRAVAGVAAGFALLALKVRLLL